MDKLRQHSMIVRSRDTLHPIFKVAFLPENLASLAETLVFIIIWLFVGIFVLNFVFILMPDILLDNAVTYIFQASSTYFLASIGLQNNLITNFILILLFINIYLLFRRYFEYIKYNLHILRAPEDEVKQG